MSDTSFLITLAIFLYAFIALFFIKSFGLLLFAVPVGVIVFRMLYGAVYEQVNREDKNL